MVKNFARFVVAALLGSLIAGCATSSVSGKKFASPSSAVTQVGVYVEQVDFRSKDPNDYRAGRIEQTMHQLLPLLPDRTQKVLAANGLQSKAVLSLAPWLIESNHDQLALLKGYPYLVRIRPYMAQYHSDGSMTIYISCLLNEVSTNKHLWGGTIEFVKPGMSKIDGEVADALIKKVLSAMAKDGMLKLNLEP